MNSDKFTPKLLGMMFVIVAVASLLGGLLLSSLSYTHIGPPDNISETMIKISDNPTTMQMSIVVELITAIGIVLLAVLLYTTLKKQNKIIALWAFGLWIGEAIILAVREISASSLLKVSQEFVKAGAPDSSNFQTLGSLFYESAQIGYGVLMVFYCLGGILFYYLFLKSKYVPIVLSLWGIIAASLGFIGTLIGFFDYDVPMYVFLPILPFELAIGIWLMVKGIRDGSEAK
ncbi:unnamed protein product [marine sediment metagenome]|uniref:DUF4386 domain-containing protein n=1 Tax=marine sediment metagenome TaxID=412755 RepID=X0WTA5_9ZZZZ